MSFLRSILIFAPLIMLSTIVMASISVACSLLDSSGRRQHAVSRAWAKMLLAIGGMRVRLEGAGRLDPGRNYLFAGNHLSLMDTPVLLASIPQQFLFLVNAKYVRLPFLGWHLRRSGHLAVEPDNVKASLRVMTEAAGAARDRGLSLLLFPEGSRSRGGLQEFKAGAAYIAIKSGVPVVPFAIRGTREVLPVGSVHLRPGAVELIFGEPIPVEGRTVKDREEFTRLMRERVAELMAGGARQSAAGQTVS